MNDQQPAAESLIERVESVAGCRLGNLGEKRLGITQQQGLQRPSPLKLGSENIGLHPHGAICHLHNRLVGRDAAAQEDRQPQHAFMADHFFLHG